MTGDVPDAPAAVNVPVGTAVAVSQASMCHIFIRFHVFFDVP